MTHPQQTFSSEQFADLLYNELALYFEAKGTRFERLFYFPGQDPFHRGAPADAIASLYWSLPVTARGNFRDGMISVLAKRVEVAPPDMLIQIIQAIGMIHDPMLLSPMVRVLGQRIDDQSVIDAIYVRAVSVIAGFGPELGALEATWHLLGLKSFPNYLSYDLLEFLMGDTNTLWSAHFFDLLPRLEADYRPNQYDEIRERLCLIVETIEDRIGLNDIAQGLNDLLDDDQLQALYTTRHMPPRGVQTMLLHSLLLSQDAPFKLVEDGKRNLLLSSRDGIRSIVVKGRFEDLLPLYSASSVQELDCLTC